jgi:hypothetical protein
MQHIQLLMHRNQSFILASTGNVSPAILSATAAQVLLPTSGKVHLTLLSIFLLGICNTGAAKLQVVRDT